MNIVCATDNDYVKYCCTMLVSFFENNPNEPHSIYLLTEGLSFANRELVENIVKSYCSRFYYYKVDASLLSSCPIGEKDHLTIATYYRLFMSEILPNDLDKVLYLDCDIIINQSILEFWNTDLSNYAVAAVEEMGTCNEDVYERLDFDPKYGYFNAGVLLVNLKFWRTYSMQQRFFDYISKHSAKLKAHDQDVLNALLHKYTLLVPYKWNVEGAFYYYFFIKRMKYNRELCYTLRHPAIIHYTWRPKPWEKSCKHPFRMNYFIYQTKASFEDTSSLKSKVRRLWDKYFFCCLIFLHISGRRFYRLK